MKCQHCLVNEANFHYRSNINGEVKEQHLCAGCAQSGEDSLFAGAMAGQIEALGGLFQSPLLGGSLLGGGLFGIRPAFAPRHQGPEVTGAHILAAAPGPEEALVPTEADDQLKQRRHLNSLRQEMQRAVEEENFERAAQLRDEIYQLEKDM